MNIEKYKAIAGTFDIKDILLISPDQITFDVRSVLKCRWGCDYSKNRSAKCDARDISIDERRQIVMSYKNIFLLHNHNAREMTHACLEIEKELFLDGYYYAATLRSCNYCEDCSIKKGKECPHPEKVRPCEEMFGIDVFTTVNNLGLPLQVLKGKDEIQNRYGFILVD